MCVCDSTPLLFTCQDVAGCVCDVVGVNTHTYVCGICGVVGFNAHTCVITLGCCSLVMMCCAMMQQRFKRMSHVARR